FTTSLVLWVAHVYAHELAANLAAKQRLSPAELIDIAERESGIMLAAVAPILMLLLGAAGVFDETVAIWLAFGVGLLTLAVQGLRYARVEKLGWLGTLAAITVNVALGLLIVALKVTVAH